VVVAEAAMAPMITGALLAMEHGLEPRLASAMVGLGVPLSLVTVPLWAWALRG
jgi:predicted permease